MRWVTPAVAQTFIRDFDSWRVHRATAVNNLIRGDALTEFSRLGTGIASFVLAALAIAAALALGPTGAALSFLGIAGVWTAGATIGFAARWRYRWSSRC